MGLLGLGWVDLTILLVLAFALVIGYVQGILRQVIWLAALYIAIVLGTQYHLVVGEWIRTLTFQTHPSRVVNVVAFLIIVTVVSFLLSWLAADAYPGEKIKIFPLLNQFGGSILAVITTMVFLGLLLRIINFAVGESWPYYDALRLTLAQGLRVSLLVPLLESLQEPIIGTIIPWLPGGILPAILVP
jgi:uncharacterized membrane protein required for colicin V production